MATTRLTPDQNQSSFRAGSPTHRLAAGEMRLSCCAAIRATGGGFGLVLLIATSGEHSRARAATGTSRQPRLLLNAQRPGV